MSPLLEKKPWERNGRIIEDALGRPIECDVCPCPPISAGCPADCSGCESSLTATYSGFAEPWTCGNRAVEMPRDGDTCVWDGSYLSGNCAFAQSTIVCNPADGLWHLQLVGCWTDGVDWYFPSWTSEGRAGACPPTGEYVMVSDNADADIIGIPTADVA